VCPRKSVPDLKLSNVSLQQENKTIFNIYHWLHCTFKGKGRDLEQHRNEGREERANRKKQVVKEDG
jgi:hypothetical protein